MKKIFAILALAITGTAFAADYASVDVDHVVSKGGYASSTAQYVRLGKEVAGLQLGVQSRTANVETGGLYQSPETTVGKNIYGFTPFVGMGFDNGLNGAKGADYRYTLAGVTTGTPVPGVGGYLLGGIKTRLTSSEATMTHQTLAFGTYSYPVAKNVAVNVNFSKSYQDIKENAYGLGIGFSF
jgi:hypothetical protein